MSATQIELLASANLFNLSGNPYPGRGIIVGVDETGEFIVQAYWLMGRSDNSRNRRLIPIRSRIATEPIDPSKVVNPELVLYDAMQDVLIYGEDTSEEPGRICVMSNGTQTTAVADSLENHGDLDNVLENFQYEPDSPNFTPRITAISYWDDLTRRGILQPCSLMFLQRKSPWGTACERHTFEYPGIGPGFGRCIHTYSGDGNPLPPFTGEPYLLPLKGDAVQIAETLRETLNQGNLVALAVKFIPKVGATRTHIINKY